MAKRTSKKEKGITLVALIITIIVLIILVGVTIGQIAGSDGIIKRAHNSAAEYKQKSAEEKVTLLMHEYMIAIAENPNQTLDNFLTEKNVEHTTNSDGTTDITVDGKTIKVNKDLSIADDTNKGQTGSITYTDSDNKTQTLTKDTAAGTKIGTTTFKNSDATDAEDITLDWYLFDVSDDGKTAYLVSTPTYWVPDTKNEVRGAWVPKLVSSADSKTGAMNQAIKKSTSSVTYKPSDNTWNYFKSVNSQWSAQRGSMAFASLNENEQAACYLADADIFAGIKDQVNNAEGNLKGKIQTLVGGASAEQWCKAYNKQSAAKDHQITCEYRATSVPGYIYKVNDKQSTVSNSDYWTGDKTIVGNDIYGAAYTNNRSNNSTYPFSSCWWWLASPSSFNCGDVCYVRGISSNLNHYSSDSYNGRFSLLASVAL